jgi:hypothetical protein
LKSGPVFHLPFEYRQPFCFNHLKNGYRMITVFETFLIFSSHLYSA